MKRAIRAVLAAAVLGVVSVVIAGFVLTSRLTSEMNRPHRGWEGNSVTVDLPSGVPAGRLLDRLETAGVLPSAEHVRLWLRWKGGAGALQAGEYRFDRPVSPVEVLQTLQDGAVVQHAFTIPEGWNLVQIADHIAGTGLADREALLAAFRDPAPIRDLVPDAPNLEGYLFPDTYNIPRTLGPAGIRDAMVRRFREVAEPQILDGARAHGMTLGQVVSLAAMIEKETSVPDERTRISRVFHNRMRLGMKMQCDPTVRYAWHLKGVEVDRLLFKHLELESPWNTYVFAGLPPTPIANPGAASLRAAVQPDDGADLYFVAAPDGGHTFSESLDDHNRAVAVWRRHRRRAG